MWDKGGGDKRLREGSRGRGEVWLNDAAKGWEAGLREEEERHMWCVCLEMLEGMTVSERKLRHCSGTRFVSI